LSERLQTSPRLAALGRVAHGFSTRHGGVSKGIRASLDLNDADVALRTENWRRLLEDASAPPPSRVAWLEQVHGDHVVRVDAPSGVHEPVARGDAAFTTESDLVLAVRTADCVPVLVAGPGVVAVAHSGWRGTASDVVGALVRALQDRVGVDPSDLVAAVGPAIGGDVYEVGAEVVDGLASSGLPPEAYGHAPSPDHPEDRAVVDLKAAVVAQLRRRGVVAVDVSSACTLRDTDLYSVRREGPTTGRQAGFIARRS